MRFKRRNNKKALLFFFALLASVFVANAQVSLPPALEIPRCPGNAAAFDRASQPAAAFDCAELSDGLGVGHSSADAPAEQNADSGQPASPTRQAADAPAAPDHQIRAFQYYSLCYRESYEQAELGDARGLQKVRLRQGAFDSGGRHGF